MAGLYTNLQRTTATVDAAVPVLTNEAGQVLPVVSQADLDERTREITAQESLPPKRNWAMGNRNIIRRLDALDLAREQRGLVLDEMMQDAIAQQTQIDALTQTVQALTAVVVALQQGIPDWIAQAIGTNNTAFVAPAIQALVGGMLPESMDTLLELVTHLQADESGMASLLATQNQDRARVVALEPRVQGAEDKLLAINQTALPALQAIAAGLRTDLTNISGTVSTNLTTLQAADTANAQAIATVKTTAENATQAAATANTNANAATSAATAATTTAASAKTTADTAKATADAAANTAATAKNTADAAKSTADTATSTANTAKTTADSATAAATSATSTANTAKGTADTAKTTADATAALPRLKYRNGATATDQAAKLYTATGTTDSTGKVTLALPAGYFTAAHHAVGSVVRAVTGATQYGSCELISLTATQVVLQVWESKSTSVVLHNTMVEGLEASPAGLSVTIEVTGI